MVLAPLATAADLQDRGIDSADSQTSLAVASATIREAAGSTISQVTSTVTMPAPRGNLLTLPGPIVSVDSVVINGGQPLTLGTDFYIDGNSLWRGYGWDYCGRPVPVVVTYTHGLATVPDDIIDLTCSLAAMWVAAQAVAFASTTGVESLQIDDYKESRTVEGSSQSQPVWLTESTRRWLAARFGTGVSVVELGP